VHRGQIAPRGSGGDGPSNRRPHSQGVRPPGILSVRAVTVAAAPAADGSLGVTVDYDRTNLAVGAAVAVTATVTNRGADQADVLLVDVGTPPGFVVRPAGLDALVARGTIRRYTLSARGVIVYLDRLPVGGSVSIRYDIAATMPIKAVSGPTEVYTHYAPDRRAAARPARFQVK